MEQFKEKFERKCLHCGSSEHLSYEHKAPVDIEAKRKTYMESLKRGRTSDVEKSQTEIKKGRNLTSPESQQAYRKKLMEGKGAFEEIAKENIEKLRKGYKKSEESQI